MKSKPAVRNELFLEDVLTLHHEDEGVTLRCALQWSDMLCIKVHEPLTEEYRNVYMLFTSDQVEQLITLWTEWKDAPEDAQVQTDE
jgi:hypothetical protein